MIANGIVQKLWNYCNILRDDGLSYGEYVEEETPSPQPSPASGRGGIRGKMADERSPATVLARLRRLIVVLK